MRLIAVSLVAACGGAAGAPATTEPSVTTTATVAPTLATTEPLATTTTEPPSTTTTLPPSPPGLTWGLSAYDEPALGGPGTQVMQSVAAGGPGLVAVGYDGTEEDFDAAVWVSSDGMAWVRVPHDEAVFGGDFDQVMMGVVAGGPGLIAVGSTVYRPASASPRSARREASAVVWVSDDGLHWSRLPHAAAFAGEGFVRMHAISAAGPGFVAVGYEGQEETVRTAVVWTSPDGIDWSRVPASEEVFGGHGDQIMWAVTPGGPGVVAVGTAHDSGWRQDAAVWTSPDGRSWSRVSGHEAVFGGPDDITMYGVAAGGPGLVAVGCHSVLPPGINQAAVWVSADGLAWERVAPDEEVFGDRHRVCMQSVAAGGPGLVAVGRDWPDDDGEVPIWTSADGLAWRRVLLPAGEYFWTDANGALVVTAAGRGWANIDVLHAVIPAGPGLVAVGTRIVEPNDYSAAAVYSPG